MPQVSDRTSSGEAADRPQRHRAIRRSAMATGISLALAVSPLWAASAGSAPSSPSAQSPTRTGFVKPFAGTARFQHLAPTQLTDDSQLNQPIGQQRADKLARSLGLKKSKVFTDRQFRRFVSGKGVGGDTADAKLVDASVGILTNTNGRPLVSKINGKRVKTVLASYGLMVNRAGMLQSPANTAAPTRQVNSVLMPGGYLTTWCRANGARKSLRQLNRSAYLREAVYGNQAQQQSGAAQLVTNRKRGARSTVGMSMAPALWIVNFLLIYTLKPELAAEMPARWAPIPPKVAKAIKDSSTGQVPYERFAKYLD